MINFRNVMIFLFTAIIFFNNQLCEAQASQGNDEDILDLIIPVIISTKLSTQESTLSSFANASGISLNEIEHIHIIHYTTGFNTKTDCISMEGFLGTTWCTGWATFYRDQTCTWYLDAPAGDSIKMKVQVASDVYQDLVAILVNIIKSKISEYIQDTLMESTIVSAVSAFLSEGSAAAPAFTATFYGRMAIRIANLASDVDTAIHAINASTGGFKLIQYGFPINSDNIHQSCNWSEWKRA